MVLHSSVCAGMFRTMPDAGRVSMCGVMLSWGHLTDCGICLMCFQVNIIACVYASYDKVFTSSGSCICYRITCQYC